MPITPPLFIGRFQPFHRGHLDVVKQILGRHKKIIIGIGSSQHSGTPENPFSGEMRARMIQNSLRDEGIGKQRFTIIQIPDINNDDKWVAHVEAIAPAFAAIYSGTPKVQALFEKDGKHKVQSPKFNLLISGTEVREKMARGQPWEDLVPPAVVKIIKNHANQSNHF